MSKNIGSLKIRAYEAQEAIPVSGVKITVYEKSEGTLTPIHTLVTDANGETKELTLESKPKEISLAPSDQTPYEVYDVKAELPGYYTKYYVDLPIFANNVSIQKVPMVPLPKNDGNQEIQYIIEKEPSNL